MSPPTSKVCTRCGQERPLEQFASDRSRADGLNKWCRTCVGENSRRHYERNREKVLSRQAERREADPEHFREIARKSQEKNQERHRAYNRERYRANRTEILEKSRWAHRARRYGITLDQFTSMLSAQGGCCAVCRRADDQRWHVDHDHGCCPGTMTCGKCVRGILCSGCNIALGFLRDDPEICERAATYLRGR